MSPAAPAAAKAAAAEGDLVYRMARWPRLLFRQESEGGGFIADAMDARKEGTWPAVVRELFGRLYGTGTERLAETPQGNEWAQRLHEQADAVPEWRALEERVRGDAWRAAMGAGQVAQVLAQHMPDLPNENAAAMQAEADMMSELMQNGRVNAALLQQRGELQKRIAAARAAGQAVQQKLDAVGGFAARSALRKAAQAATQAIDECEAAMEGIGAGVSETPGKAATPAQRRAMMKRMSGDARLRRIAMLAGRLRLQAARKQRTKTTAERSEVVSITLGDDVRHLVASEIGQLVTAARPFVLERIAEKRALVHELGGKSTKARGPLVFLIDASGSMEGARDEWAKACAMAMMEVARIQRRPFAVVHFDGGIKHKAFFDAGNATTERVLEVLGIQPTGGTFIAGALEQARAIVACEPQWDGVPSAWRAGKDADVVLLTDGADSSDKAPACEALKKLGASIYTVAIECPCPNDLRVASVEVVEVRGSDMKAASPKLDGLFSM